MDRSRRTFLTTLAAWGITSVVWFPISHRARAGILGALPIATEERVPQATLVAVLDTLIPEDTTPGAEAVGLLDEFIAIALRDPAFRRLMVDGCRWLDTRAGARFDTRFAELDEPNREQIVEEAASAPVGSMPREFFQAVWDEAIFHYYADPRAWPGLGFAAPPQPLGYPGHADAPHTAAE